MSETLCFKTYRRKATSPSMKNIDIFAWLVYDLRAMTNALLWNSRNGSNLPSRGIPRDRIEIRVLSLE
jgi:hypothetical protein